MEAPAVTDAIVVMGVAGSGKTSVGQALARRLALPFRDADEFHSPANVAKMAAGVALDDDDRWPWLDAIGKVVADAPGGIVVTCSALKHAYRDRLRRAAGRKLVFVHLAGSPALLARRIGNRKGHFMPARLLDSQLATLEPLAADEDGFTISIEPPVETIAAEAAACISRHARPR